ncbi:MAG: VanZ family protein [Acidimicrobiales bacterium]
MDVLFGVYLAGVAYGVFGPNPGSEITRAGERVREVEAEVRSLPPGDTAEGSPARSGNRVAGVTTEDLANIAMFVPFGLLFPMRWPRWSRWTVLAGAGLSAGIELTQWAFLSWRYPSADDVLWNTAGAALGYAAWLVAGAAGERAALNRR